MMPFLILSWPAQCVRSGNAAAKLRASVRSRQPQWRLLLDEPGRLVAVGSSGPFVAGRCRGEPTFLIGDLFSRGARAIEELPGAARSFADLCHLLRDDFWGAYIAVQLGEPYAWSIFRDPVGMRDAIGWSHGNLWIFASEAAEWLMLAPPADLAIDGDRIAELLFSSSTVAEATPLTGIETLAAGALIEFGDGKRTARRLWEPRRFYGGHARHGLADELSRTTTMCIDAWLTAYPKPFIEISGGFDSAVVAAVATRTQHKFEMGINFFVEDLAGDERRFARDLAVRHAIALHEIFLPVGRLSEADLDGMPVGVRPGIGSTTLVHDRLLAELAAAKRARTLVTGHGGDAIFFQHPTPMIAADPSFPRTKLQAYHDLAQWSKSSVWTVARHAWRGGFEPASRGDSAPTSLPLAAGTRRKSSAWAGNLEGLPPAKTLQIRAIAGDRSAFGPSWRSQALTVLHPLLSQPLVEVAISIDSFELTAGRRDRALARDIFHDILPASIVERRGKGALGAFFGRMLAASGPFLRAYLLDGQLVRHGILDRAALEIMLDRDQLMRVDCYGAVFSALVTEHWIRVWLERLDAIRQNHNETPALP